MSSVFDAPTTEQTQQAPTIESWVEEVVKEKGDNWKDPEVLAKGYAHAQERIKELEKLAEGLKEQDYAKSLLEKLQAQQAPEPEVAPVVLEEPKSETEQENTSLSPEDIDRLLESKLSARERQVKVESVLREKFGDDANRIIHERSEQLGLSIDRMRELASESPDAFLRLIGEPEQKQTNKGLTSSVNSSGFNSTPNERNAEYYKKLRRENRRLYNDPKTQIQMLNDKRRLGEQW